MRLTVRVTPRGGRDAVEGWVRDDAGRAVLKLRVAAAAADGAANAAVIALLAQALDIPRSRIAIVRGATARVKQVEAEGLSLADLDRALGRHPRAELGPGFFAYGRNLLFDAEFSCPTAPDGDVPRSGSARPTPLASPRPPAGPISPLLRAFSSAA
jgi:uncharacterized protein YggU (UPF0235/DUF167 family)